MIKQLAVKVNGQGLHSFTGQVATAVADAGLQEGLCTLFIRHTSETDALPAAFRGHSANKWIIAINNRCEGCDKLFGLKRYT